MEASKQTKKIDLLTTHKPPDTAGKVRSISDFFWGPYLAVVASHNL